MFWLTLLCSNRLSTYKEVLSYILGIKHEKVTPINIWKEYLVLNMLKVIGWIFTFLQTNWLLSIHVLAILYFYYSTSTTLAHPMHANKAHFMFNIKCARLN